MMIIKNKKAAILLGFVSILLITFGMVNYLKNKSLSSNEDLGTFKTPEEAFKETQKALNLLSTNINSGIESANGIKEYENTKNKVFKNKN